MVERVAERHAPADLRSLLGGASLSLLALILLFTGLSLALTQGSDAGWYRGVIDIVPAVAWVGLVMLYPVGVPLALAMERLAPTLTWRLWGYTGAGLAAGAPVAWWLTIPNPVWSLAVLSGSLGAGVAVVARGLAERLRDHPRRTVTLCAVVGPAVALTMALLWFPTF